MAEERRRVALETLNRLVGDPWFWGRAFVV